MMHSTSSDADKALPKQSFLESFEEGQAMEWLSKNGKNLAYGLMILLVLLFTFYRFSSRHTGKAEHDYLQASSDFNFFTRVNDAEDTGLVEDAFQRLNLLMIKHTDLHAAYDGAIGQVLLNRNQAEAAQPYIERTLKRTKVDDLPFYGDYGSTSLLIGLQKYGEALKMAETLQQKMAETIAKEPSSSKRLFGDELFALNLLRIAILQQQLGDKEGEWQSWQAWKKYAGLDAKADKLPLDINAQAFQLVIQQLAAGSVSLPDYIAHREKDLLKK